MFAPGKEPAMSTVDQIIKSLIIEQLEKTKDTDLLDLIYKLLVTESGQQPLDTGVLRVG